MRAAQYFGTYQKDPTWIKGLVAFVVTVDFVSTISGYALFYQVNQLGNGAGSWDV